MDKYKKNCTIIIEQTKSDTLAKTSKSNDTSKANKTKTTSKSNTNKTQISSLPIEDIVLNGKNREYSFYKPENLTSDASLIFYFHGSIFLQGENKSLKDGVLSSNKYHILNEIAKEHNAIVVYPYSSVYDSDNAKASAIAYWREEGDEIAYFDKLVEHFKSTYSQINDKKIYVSGHSSGASFSFRLAGLRANIIAAAAPVSGSKSIRKNAQITVDFTNDGISTPIIAFRGENDFLTKGMKENMDTWQEVENKGTITTATEENIQVGNYNTIRKTYNDGISDIIFYTVKDVAHGVSWREIAPIMWDFMKSHIRE